MRIAFAKGRQADACDAIESFLEIRIRAGQGEAKMAGAGFAEG